eukprot:1547426-Alexandrium_andersonii.AAC.1
MGRGADGYDLDPSHPHSTVTKHSSRGQTYLESRPRSNGVSRGDFASASGGESRGYGIPPITVIWGCNELVDTE